jgi:DNA-binding MarR family transcriptional regulator
MKTTDEQTFIQMKERLHVQLKDFFDVEDARGLELIALIHSLSNLTETVEMQQAQQNDGEELSGARWRLLMRLFTSEQLGYTEGLTPTMLSQFNRVSKNTISALLRGLEDQGLIRRTLDAQDYRIFRIQLTDAGREMIKKSSPQRIHAINQIFSDLDSKEMDQLLALLEKLEYSLIKTQSPGKQKKA